MFKLLPCSYANSEEIVEWLDACSTQGYLATKINNIYAKFEKVEPKRYYHCQINSVTDQAEFSQNGACSKDHIIYKMKEKGFHYVGKCGSYLYFQTENEKLVQYFDTKERHQAAIKNALITQVLLFIVFLIITIQIEKIIFKEFASNLILRNIEFGLFLYPCIYSLLELIEVFKKKKDENPIPIHQREVKVSSSLPNIILNILFILMILIILFQGLLA